MNKHKLTGIILAILMMLMSFPETKAISGSVRLSASSTSVTVGDTVTITVSVSCQGGSISSYRLNYNSEYMTLTSYPSGDFNPATGRLVIDTESNSASKTFKFRTGGVGSTTISLSVLEFYGLTDSNVTGYSTSLSTTIKVNQRSSGGGGGGGGGGYTPSKSSVATLSSITLENGTLEQAFSPDVEEYKVYLPKGTEKLGITAKVSHGKATIGTINDALKPGWNKVTIEVTAEAGNKKTYTINAYVDEEPEVFLDYGDKKLGVVKNTDKAMTYEGFTTQQVKVNEEQEVTVFNRDAYHIVYLEDEEGNRDFYNFDRIKKTVDGVYKEIELAGKLYHATNVNYAEYPEMEELFDPAEIEFEDGSIISGWRYKDTMMREFAVVPVATNNGIYNLYRYDFKEKTIQRYLEPPKPAEAEPSQPLIDPNLGVACAAVGGISLLFSIILLVTRRKK